MLDWIREYGCMAFIVAIFITLFAVIAAKIGEDGEAQKRTYAIIADQLDEEYPLARLHVRNTTSMNASGGFFLIAGAFQAQSQTSMTVKFSWLTEQGYYMVTTVPIERIRIRLDEQRIVPSVYFTLVSQTGSYKDPLQEPTQEFIDQFVRSVTIRCSREHWPLDFSGLSEL